MTVAAAVLLGAGGVGAARFVKSPGEKAAEAKAPAASVISAVVERRVLSDTVVLRGTVVAGQTVAVSPRVSVAGGKDGGGGAKPVVTGVRVKAGDALEPGRVLIEVSGRPVFVLPGELPVYRDLKPGSEGRDVEQLQAALKGLGHEVGSDKAGVYGAGTRAAVAAFYKGAGYDAPAAGEGGDEAIKAAEERVTGLERSLSQAKDALRAARDASAAGAAPSGGAASAGGAGSTAPPAGDKAADKPADKSGGQGGTKAAEQQVRYATEDLAKAKDALSALKAKSGAMLPAGEVVFLSRFPARVDAVHVAVGGEVKEKALTVSAGDLVVRGQLSPSDKGLVRPGSKVRILAELSGVEATGEVRSVADAPDSGASPGSEGGQGSQQGSASAGVASGRGYEVIVAPSEALDPKSAGQDVRLTVEAATSGGPVLVVPLSAVSAGADGRTVVTVVDSAGVRRRVEVRPGTSGDGYVEVAPVGGAALADGDRVVVGAARKDASSTGGNGDKGGPVVGLPQSGPRS
ncbi:peptidoglycan-binding protein [Streptomyces sp. SID3343]|uniref:peptidoglycan-binding protein n=1 Tax=Streptomyces sp. SID3343 TaxID=2690260 RepID=UPI00136C3AA3|nr:peptidoglycan-binding protein [Streptomyces sp. SID3343]MYW06503.1 peptidoglycan-binding protein [Streptomyces sp. SID3343]